LVIVFAIGLAMNVFSGHWSAAGVFLLLFAFALPNYAKRRRLAAMVVQRPGEQL
jgi:hypothetical protein